MKATLAKDLVIGKIYSDISKLNERSTLLRYKGRSDKGLTFDYITGQNDYMGKKNLLFGESAEPFYELSPSEIEQYLPKEKP